MHPDDLHRYMVKSQLHKVKKTKSYLSAVWLVGFGLELKSYSLSFYTVFHSKSILCVRVIEPTTNI